jgi:hypothetical protein
MRAGLALVAAGTALTLWPTAPGNTASAHTDQPPAITASTEFVDEAAITTIRMGSRTVWITSPLGPVAVGGTFSVGVVMDAPPRAAIAERAPTRMAGPADDAGQGRLADAPAPVVAITMDGVTKLPMALDGGVDQYLRSIATLQVPAGAPGVLGAQLRGLDGRPIFETPLPRLGSRAWAPDAAAIQLPSLGQRGSHIEVVGPFDGDATTTDVRIGDHRAFVLAETPTRSWFYSPADAIGRLPIRIRDGQASASGEYRSLAIELTAPKTSLLRGERTTLSVDVRGLEGLTEDAPLFLFKAGAIAMQDGDVQLLRIRPRDVSAGRFGLTRALRGTAVGNFGVVGIVWDPRRPVRFARLEEGADVNGFRPRKTRGGTELTFDSVLDPYTGAKASGERPVEVRCSLTELPFVDKLLFRNGGARMETRCLVVLVTPRIVFTAD